MKEERNLLLYLAATIGNLIAFTAGIGYSWSSPVLPKLNGNVDPDNNPLGRSITVTEESLIAALVPLGAILGPIAAGPIANKFGRKKALIFIACPLLLSFLMIAFAKKIILFFVGRFLMGMSCGSVFSVLPMYLIEISEDHNRGIVSCLMNAFVSAGILFTNTVGPLLTIQNFCLVCTVPLIIFFCVFTLWSPESPQFLALCNDSKGLKSSLLKLRCKPLEDIEKEVLHISKNVQELNQTKSGIKELFSTIILRKSLIISLGLITLQQLGGIAAVISYTQTIFDAGGGELSPYLSTVVIGVVQLSTTILTSSLVDRLGRRILYIFSTIGCCFSLFSLGLYFFLRGTNFQVDAIFWLPMVSLMVFVIFFNLGSGPLPWTIMAEIFPTNHKSSASVLTTVVCSIGNFTITLCFPYISGSLGMGPSFWIFSIAYAVNTIFVYFMLPETKGKSMQEIQTLISGHSK